MNLLSRLNTAAHVMIAAVISFGGVSMIVVSLFNQYQLGLSVDIEHVVWPMGVIVGIICLMLASIIWDVEVTGREVPAE